jgi:ethanolamine-phosphate cytidylyltransferase
MTDPTTAAPVWVYVDCVSDLFHLGHVRFFEQARSFGDRLVVGLHSDADVATYKPAPILSFAERLEVVRACRLVDRVIEHPVPFHVTPAALDSYGATYVCHADDMSPEQLEYWYGELVPAGRLKIARYTAGISSRDIVARVAERLKAGTLRIRL